MIRGAAFRARGHGDAGGDARAIGGGLTRGRRRGVRRERARRARWSRERCGEDEREGRETPRNLRRRELTARIGIGES